MAAFGFGHCKKNIKDIYTENLYNAKRTHETLGNTGVHQYRSMPGHAHVHTLGWKRAHLSTCTCIHLVGNVISLW